MYHRQDVCSTLQINGRTVNYTLSWCHSKAVVSRESTMSSHHFAAIALIFTMTASIFLGSSRNPWDIVLLECSSSPVLTQTICRMHMQ